MNSSPHRLQLQVSSRAQAIVVAHKTFRRPPSTSSSQHQKPIKRQQLYGKAFSIASNFTKFHHKPRRQRLHLQHCYISPFPTHSSNLHRGNPKSWSRRGSSFARLL
ncbi:hypothetical protein FLAG1_07247 [Fusarium langsethiae]|uniref:Uncharacterized protein n=1 Tax=Fusarium langsethiae TaxID=179993 RepID=A0A0M9EU26_FUSLA|nr:hypothetical protein FLAG1_07247 [Fusarium langsethiae]